MSKNFISMSYDNELCLKRIIWQVEHNAAISSAVHVEIKSSSVSIRSSHRPAVLWNSLAVNPHPPQLSSAHCLMTAVSILTPTLLLERLRQLHGGGCCIIPSQTALVKYGDKRTYTGDMPMSRCLLRVGIKTRCQEHDNKYTNIQTTTGGWRHPFYHGCSGCL